MNYTTIQNAATKIVDNLKSIDGSINALQNKQDIISTSDMSMANSHNGKLKFEEIGGKSEQFTTTGKNLFDISNVTSGGYDVITGTATDTLRLYRTHNPITVTPLNDYVFSYVPYTSDSEIRVFEYNEDDAFIRTYLTPPGEIFKTSDGCSSIKCHMLDGFDVNCMLNAGSTALPYEPYTGGIPAPNPDYPQEIKKTVVSEIKTHGKNLLENIAVTRTVNSVETTVNNDKSITLKGTASANFVQPLGYVELKKNNTYTCASSTENVHFSLRQNNGITIIHNFKADNCYTPDKSEIVEVFMRIQNGTTVDETVYPMIREVGTDNTYEPYTESTIKLSEPIELYGIGDVKDTIEDGKVVRRFASVTLKGNEDEDWNANTNSRVYIKFEDIKIPAISIDTNNVLCSHFRQVVKNVNYETFGTFAVEKNTGVLYFREESATSIDSWKVWLTENPILVIYELATPVTEPLPAVDQIALSSLSTYDAVTYLDFDSEIEPTFRAEYGVTEIGGRVLDDLMIGLNSEILAQSDADRITTLESTIVNNI